MQVIYNQAGELNVMPMGRKERPMDKDRSKICEIISEMLDNPDKHGIYPTTKAYDALEGYCEKIRAEAIGWTHADACIHIDKGVDYRKVNVPEILERALKDLA